MIEKMTVAQAAKRMKKWSEEVDLLLQREELVSVFHAALGEVVEEVRPPYDYQSTQEKLARLEAGIRALKHAVNLFNTTHLVGESKMTVDEVLVYLPQLARRKDKYAAMAGRLEKSRSLAAGLGSNTVIDYEYANYSIEQAQADYNRVCEEISSLQMALDLLNNTEMLEADLPE